jgi:hypothetical protein
MTAFLIIIAATFAIPAAFLCCACVLAGRADDPFDQLHSAED